MKNFNFKIIMIAVLLWTSLPLLRAQNPGEVSGTVTDGQSDEPLPGVTVMIAGTNSGTVTDVDGNYSLSVSGIENPVLKFSFVGYLAEEVEVAGQSVINLQMLPSIETLEEMVVVGYGTVRKEDLTGSVSVVDGEELGRRNVSDVTQALQGLLGGVQVSSNSGAPGAQANVLVRGISTINNNSPLYVVDDVPLDDISWLNPNDIESVQVLKDASSAAIFGSRASNGVIIIETKKATEGRTSIVLDATTSIHQTAKTPNMANATEYAMIANQAALNSGQDAPFTDPAVFGSGTNWWDQATQPALSQNYSLNINKGTEDLKVSAGLSYFDQEGIVKGGDYQRITLRLNSDFKLNDRITIGENFNLSRDITDNGPNLVWDVMRAEPIIPVYLPEYEQEGKNEFSIFHPTTRTDIANPMGNLARSFSQTNYLRAVGNVFANVDAGLGFSFESKFAFYLSNWENNWFSPDYYIEPTDRLDINSVGRTHNNRTNYTWNNLLNYAFSNDNHDFRATTGFTMESFEHRTLNASGNELPGNQPHFRYLEAATTGYWADGVNERNTQSSYLARINYSYNYKYLLTASFRADGSSRFAEENRWGYFSAVSGAWNIHDEDFLNDVNWLSQLKIRAGWGQVGNQDIWNDALLTTLGRTIYVFGADQSLDLGMAPATVGNSGLIWETVEDFNLGLDFGIFNQSLTLSLDYFERQSEDMLMQMSIPLYLGAAFSYPWANVGRLSTQGIELVTSYEKQVTGDLYINANLNLSRSRSVMDKMAFGEEILSGNHQRLDMLTRTAEGQTAGAFYGWETDGIFQNEMEVINYTDEFGNIIQPNAQPGDFRFVDNNGDGRIDDADRAVIGNPEPDFSYGFFFNVRYRAFDMNVLFNGTYGNDVLNAIKPYTHSGNGVYNSYDGIMEDAWDGAGSSNAQPRIAAVDNNQNFRYSDYYIEDGSYLRLRSFQIGYNLPNSLTQRVNMTKARIFVGGENLFTISSFSGLDPDLGGGALERGIDWGQYPLPRIFMAGINVSI